MKGGRFAFALLAALFAASGAQAREYDCHRPGHAPGGEWKLYDEIVKQAYDDFLARPDADTSFNYLLCGTVEDGQQTILMNAVREIDGKKDCADPANFALLYDTKKRSFSDKIPSQDFCGPAGASAPAGGGAQASAYDCANPDAAPEGHWDMAQDQAKAFYTDAMSQPFASGFLLRFCGVIVKGEQLVMIGAIRMNGSERVCDDPSNFGLIYDPKKRSYGDKVVGQTFICPK